MISKVGGGHTAAGFKAVAAGCPTPMKNIADSAGNLNKQIMAQNDSEMSLMIEEGWQWTVLPWHVERTWPKLPDLAQRALSASNAVSSEAGGNGDSEHHR